jgi:UDP-N-acetylmuramate dehydrogenase
VKSVQFFDGETVREFDNAACEFHYRESVFKKHKEWIIFSAELEFDEGDAAQLRRQADETRRIRDEKYPSTMKCAGSIFKNLILSGLSGAVRARVPGEVVREGKVPSAWFLEQAGAKGMKNGGIEVAAYHANLIYTAGGGTSRQAVEIIDKLKARVQAQFGLLLEEEVQYVGFL